MKRGLFVIFLMVICVRLDARLYSIPVCMTDTVSTAEENNEPQENKEEKKSEKQDGDSVIVVTSRYEQEKKERIRELDSIAKISAPFTIKDPRFISKDEKKLILQDRYLEVGKKFGTRLFERLDVGLFSGYYKIAPRGNARLKGGTPLGVNVKYNFDRLRALRLGYSYTAFEDERTRSELRHHSFDIDFMYNLSSLMYGHDRGRILSFSPVLGIGYINVKGLNESHGVIKGQVGMNMDLRLSPSAHIFAEPFFAVTGDNVDLSGDSNPHKWDMMYGVRGGLIIRFNSESDSLSRASYNHNFFTDFAQGVTFFSGPGTSLIQSAGSSYRLSIGRWFDPLMGLRLSGVASYYTHATTYTPAERYMGFIVTPAYKTNARTTMYGGRLDLMLNVLNFFKGYRMESFHPFSWVVSAGFEYGFMDKNIPGSEVNLKTYYAGAVFSTQLIFSPQKNFSLYLEPSLLLANYSVPYTNAPDRKAKYMDKIPGVNIGVRLYCPPSRERHEYTDEFEPRNFAGLTGGFVRDYHKASYSSNGGFQWTGGAQVGREFMPCLAAKLQVEVQKINHSDFVRYSVDDGTIYTRPALFNDELMLLNVKALYMLNMSNLYFGYRSDRRLNFFLEFGPSYIRTLKRTRTMYNKEMKGGTTPTPLEGWGTDKAAGAVAACIGCVLDMKVSKRIHVMLDGGGQFLFKSNVFMAKEGSNQIDIIMNTNVGVTYDF